LYSWWIFCCGVSHALFGSNSERLIFLECG
jgi:hypothetical protein